MRALSQRLHMRRSRLGEHRACRYTLLARRGPGSSRGRFVSKGGLPADALTELHGLALLLAAVERRLEPRGEDHEQREEDHHAEAEEGDDLVVRLPVEALAVVAGEGRRGGNQPGREDEERSELAHARGTIPCRAEWPIPSSASSRSRREAATSTSTTTSREGSGSTAFSSRRSSIPPITASSRTRSRSTATRST